MKILHSLFFRAMCGLVSGVLLLMYRDEMYQWVTIVLGIVFFLSGVASCILYLAERKRASKEKARAEEVENYNKNSKKDASHKEGNEKSSHDKGNHSLPIEGEGSGRGSLSYPITGEGSGRGSVITGIASIIFGAMLALAPQTFMPWLSYIFAALLGLGSLLLIFNLAMSLRTRRLHWLLWVAPLLLFLCAVLIIVIPERLEQKDTILGTALVLYGLTEIINGLALHKRPTPLTPSREEGGGVDTPLAENKENNI